MHYLQPIWLFVMACQIISRRIDIVPDTRLIEEANGNYIKFIWPIQTSLLPRAGVDAAPRLLQFYTKRANRRPFASLSTAPHILALDPQATRLIAEDEVWLSVFVTPPKVGNDTTCL
jgi:hypothetical protein